MRAARSEGNVSANFGQFVMAWVTRVRAARPLNIIMDFRVRTYLGGLGAGGILSGHGSGVLLVIVVGGGVVVGRHVDDGCYWVSLVELVSLRVVNSENLRRQVENYVDAD